jgi:hypothetical protein
MDNRQWSSGASGTPPTPPASPSVGYPTPGNPSLGIQSTKGGAYWFHQLGEELRVILTAAGITPDAAVLTQLLTALRSAGVFTTPAQLDNTTKAATTEFVRNVISSQYLGYKNRAINGGFNIASRNATAIIANTDQRLPADMWLGKISCTSISAGNWSTAGAGSGQRGIYAQSVSGVAVNSVIFEHRIESSNIADTYGGKLTVQCDAFHDTGLAAVVTFRLYIPTTTVDVFSALTLSATGSANAIVSGALTAVSETFDLTGIDVTLGLQVTATISHAASTIVTKSYAIRKFQIAALPFVTPFEQRPVQLENSLCRYYVRRLKNMSIPKAYINGTTDIRFASSELFNDMRTIPSLAAYGAEGVSWSVLSGATGVAQIGFTFGMDGGGNLDGSKAAHGLTDAVLTITDNVVVSSEI